MQSVLEYRTGQYKIYTVKISVHAKASISTTANYCPALICTSILRKVWFVLYYLKLIP